MLDRIEQRIERLPLKALTHRCVDRPSRIANNAMKPLARTVASFCGTLARVPDSDGPFIRLSECGMGSDQIMPSELYEQAIQIRRHLAHLGARIDRARDGTVTTTQLALQHLQLEYRNLQGLMIGVPERLLDLHLETERRTVRQLLQVALAGPRTHATMQISVMSTPICFHRASPGTLSTIFERSELAHRSLVESIRDTPDRMREPNHTRGSSLDALIVNARLNNLREHLRNHGVELSLLLKAAGHRRTVPMRLAHRIFLALGETEGAMIGAESRFESMCQPLIDLIAVRTNEVGRYC